jgi:hypothetical protein
MDFLLILRGIGLAMSLGGIALFRLHRQRRAQWTATTGRVIQMIRGSQSSNRPSRAVRPVVEFTVSTKHATTKQKFRFEGAVASWPPRYKVGDRAKVLYDPQNPQEATLDDGDSSWIAPAVLSGIGLLITFLTFAGTAQR